MKRRFWPGIEFSRFQSSDWLWTQSYLLGRFVSQEEFGAIGFRDHAASLANTGSLLSRDPSDSLRGISIVAAFLQQAGSASPPPEVPSYAPAQRQLHYGRSHLGPLVCHQGRTPTHQQDRDSAVQRHLPVLAGPLAVPRPVYPAPIPQPSHYPLRPSARQLARS